MDCETIIDWSLRRLRQERLDLVQMHWWYYDIPGYVEMALALQELQQAGKIDKIGATNFDVPRMREMFDAGVEEEETTTIFVPANSTIRYNPAGIYLLEITN